ncbi:alpha/beta hydrolase [Brevibacillus humidisoli]|uniref:alpha/beta hydrolase n=1 Tax=Brevibacillus humidisoli TaxID=2895522 RepID=UPI001E37EABA|nr:alpha/beta hydrolase [Brevibacillus humidisoli]UFJ43349.1 alpha/beta hydrolase [Brevibacillus humidisoli]
MVWVLISAAAVVLVLGAGAVIGIALTVGWRLTHPPRKPISMEPERFGMASYQTVLFPSQDHKILLSGWYISADDNGVKNNGCTLIFAHGYGQNRLEPHLPALSLASRLLAKGYDILMFDFRNAGLSEGEVTTVGLYEQRDLLGAIDYVSHHYPQQQIALIGFSMGAATSLLVAGVDHRVKAVVADSPFYSLWDYLQENLPHWTGLPHFPFNMIILTLIPLLLRANPRSVQPYRSAAGLAPRPVLLIHGTGDETVPFQDSCRLLETINHPCAEMWLVPGTGHVRSYAAYPEEYTERVLSFLERSVQDRPDEQWSQGDGGKRKTPSSP